MAQEIDPREVLEHLEYLGYTSITKQQLKDFTKDLKKLIKYEQCNDIKKYTVESPEVKISVACGTTSLSSSRSEPKHEIQSNIKYVALNSEYLEKDTIRTKRSCPGECEDSDKHTLSSRSYHAADYNEPKPPEHICVTCTRKCDEEKTNCKTCPKKECIHNDRQPCPSFIRPGMGKPSKCDPVALYHYYQNQWSKRPLPGEDPRSDLRWAIRTRLANQQQQSSNRKDGFQRRIPI